MSERDLVQLGRRARDGRAEERRGVAGQGAEPVGERPVVAVGEHPETRVRARLALPWAGHALVRGDGPFQPQSRSDEREPVAERQR